MAKEQSERLSKQHKISRGVDGIFGEEAKKHDKNVYYNSQKIKVKLEEKYPKLKFRHRKTINKSEINESLKKVDKELGQTLFVNNARIQPDGGIIEVKDDNGNWRVILVSEAKFQGKDIDNIKSGKLVGKNKNQEIMTAGSAIERSYKNIYEVANFMLAEPYFPYLIFLEGSNFLLHDIIVKNPEGREITLKYNSGTINRLDRLTAANHGLPLNTNLCENKFVAYEDRNIMLQSASIYTHVRGERWNDEEMLEIMYDIASTSLRMLGRDLFGQLTK